MTYIEPSLKKGDQGGSKKVNNNGRFCLQSYESSSRESDEEGSILFTLVYKLCFPVQAMPKRTSYHLDFLAVRNGGRFCLHLFTSGDCSKACILSAKLGGLKFMEPFLFQAVFVAISNLRKRWFPYSRNDY